MVTSQRLHPTTLESDRLTLRELSSSDAEDIFSYASNPEVTRYVFWNPHVNIEDTRRYILAFAKPRTVAWAMQHNDTDRVIGIVFLHSVNPHKRTAEIAYNVSHKVWGEGYATEAAQRVLEHCFTETNLDTIEGTCMTDHDASARVLEKAGLTFQTIKAKTRRKNGVAYDLKYFTLTRSRCLEAQTA
jgi:ribosomal-protein-alanine N-acetyltransferase